MKRVLLLLLMVQGVVSAWTQETIDRSLSRHNFLYAGEGKQQRMFIIKVIERESLPEKKK